MTRMGSVQAQGFTLLEVVLAMTALALVTAICYGAFYLGVRVVERGEVAVVTAQRLRVAADILTRQIKSAATYPAHNEDDESWPYFTGTATSMSFITAAGLRGGGGLSCVVYQVMDDPPRLVMSETKYFSPDQLGRDGRCKAEENDTGSVLLDGFRSVRMQYLLDDGVDTEWRQEWNGHDEEALPTAVQMVVDGMPGLETGAWGQEVPIMTCRYGENECGLAEDRLPAGQEDGGVNGEDDEGGGDDGDNGDDGPGDDD